MADDPASGDWHLDKRIPVALIVAMLAQFGGGVWWVSGIEFSVRNHSDKIARIESDISQRSLQGNSLDNRLTRLEEKLLNQTAILQEIKSLLDRSNRLP